MIKNSLFIALALSTAGLVGCATDATDSAVGTRNAEINVLTESAEPLTIRVSMKEADADEVVVAMHHYFKLTDAELNAPEGTLPPMEPGDYTVALITVSDEISAMQEWTVDAAPGVFDSVRFRSSLASFFGIGELSGPESQLVCAACGLGPNGELSCAQASCN